MHCKTTLIYCNTRVVSRRKLLYNMLSLFLQKGVMVIIVSTAVNVQDQVHVIGSD